MLLPADALDKPAKDRPKARNLTSEFEGSAEDFVWMADSERIYFGADDRGKHWYFVTNIKEANPPERSTFIRHHDILWANNVVGFAGE